MSHFPAMLRILRCERPEERGASALEYSLLVGLVAAVIVLVVAALGMDVLALFNAAEDDFNGSQA